MCLNLGINCIAILNTTITAATAIAIAIVIVTAFDTNTTVYKVCSLTLPLRNVVVVIKTKINNTGEL